MLDLFDLAAPGAEVPAPLKMAGNVEAYIRIIDSVGGKMGSPNDLSSARSQLFRVLSLGSFPVDIQAWSKANGFDDWTGGWREWAKDGTITKSVHDLRSAHLVPTDRKS